MLRLLPLPTSFSGLLTLLWVINHLSEATLFSMYRYGFHTINITTVCKMCFSSSYFDSVGMNYLHCEAPVKVVHRDLKSKNGDSLLFLH